MCTHLFTAGVDYARVLQAFKFAPGQSTINVYIPIRDDNVALESIITFTVAIISNGGAVVLSNATVTIVDNDCEFSVDKSNMLHYPFMQY